METIKLFSVLLLVTIFATSAAQQTPANLTDYDSALGSMRDRSYFAFIMLLEMAGRLIVSRRDDITFLIPNDRDLANARISSYHVNDFILSHSMPTALYFNNMLHFPTGTLIPTGVPNQMIDITNNGVYDFYLNNAKIVAPNICQGNRIMCHGIDAVIQFNNGTAATGNILPPQTIGKSIPTNPMLQSDTTTSKSIIGTKSMAAVDDVSSPLAESTSVPNMNGLSHVSSISAGTVLSYNVPLLIVLISQQLECIHIPQLLKSELYSINRYQQLECIHIPQLLKSALYSINHTA